MQSKKLLAVDLGASGGKCFVGIFQDGTFRMEEVHRFEHEGVGFYLPQQDGGIRERTYWDDTHIYYNIVKGLQAARRKFGERLDGIGIDTWGADGHLVTADGDLLGKVYCYRDHRLNTMCDEVRARIDADRVYEITGIFFQPFNVSNQLLWLVTRKPELLRLAECYLPIPSLFYYYLGGCRVVDSTFASVTQLMDAARGEWSSEMLEALEIPAALMPEIVKPGSRVGVLQPQLAGACGLGEVPLYAVGAHDTASAFAAAPVKDTASALIISSGTWSLVGKLVDEPITTGEAMRLGLSNEGGIGNTRLLRNCMGTWIVQELLRNWEVEDGVRMEWREVDSITPAASPFKGFIDPDDRRFYNPSNMEEAIRSFLSDSGQAQPASRAAILRCVYESLALKYRYVSEMINSVTGTRTEVVHIVGGGSSNLMLNQFTADSLGVEVVAGPREATAVGNLMVQAMGAGIIKDLREAMPLISSAFPVATFQPEDHGRWDVAYREFCRYLR